MNAFCHLVFTILDMNNGEKLEKFYPILKTHVRLGVPKARSANFDGSARIELNVENAMFGASMFLGGFQYAGQQKMVIGFQKCNPRNRRSSFKGNQMFREQRRKGIGANECFKC